MYRYPGFFIFFILCCTCSCSNQEPSSKGHLVIIGGGNRPLKIMQKFVELCGAQKAKIAIIPTASSFYEESGAKYEQEFQELGAEKATSFNIISKAEADNDSVLQALAEYSGYFFGGGDQNRLMEYFLGSKALKLFHDQYQAGATFGGTSAGAAIMSSIMITGEGNWEVAIRDSVQTSPGFGFIDQVIIDQHFFRRKRFNRLLNAVIQTQSNGIGIDESTALWIKPDNECEVLGQSIIIVLGKKKARFAANDSSNLLTVQGMEISVYKEKDRFRLN